MENQLSRRCFIKKSALTLGGILALDISRAIVSSGKFTFNAHASEVINMKNGKSHVIVKLWPGRSERTKQRFAEAVAENIVTIIGCDEASVSVDVEEVSSADWKENVYTPEIKKNIDNLYKKPGYSM